MRALLLSGVALALVSLGCDKPIDLTKGLRVSEVSTGWHDAGIVNGMNKLVPSVTFRFQNESGQALNTLQANVIFRRVGEDAEWGSSYVRLVGSEGLAAGAATEAHTVNCPKGYTGSESRLQILQNSQFVDARVRVFAKYGSTQWQLVGEFPVERRLLGQ